MVKLKTRAFVTGKTFDVERRLKLLLFHSFYLLNDSVKCLCLNATRAIKCWAGTIETIINN